MAQEEAAQCLARSWLITEFRFEKCKAGIDQVVADVFLGTFAFTFSSEINCCLRDLEFAGSSSFADSLDDVAITIARGKLHPAINSSGILSQYRLDQTDLLKEVVPVECGKQPHAGNDVSDSDLRLRLPLVFQVNDLFDDQVLPG